MRRIFLIVCVGQAIGWLLMLAMFIYDCLMNTNLVSNGFPIGSIFIVMSIVFIYFFKRDSIIGTNAKYRVIVVMCITWLTISIAIGIAIVTIANSDGITREVRPNLIEFTTFGFILGLSPVLSVIIGEPINKAIKRG